jgi:hypothetical protein
MLPYGGEIERLQESADSVDYWLPPNIEIRFPTNIRLPLAMVVAQSVAAICLWDASRLDAVAIDQQAELRPRPFLKQPSQVCGPQKRQLQITRQ